MPGMQDVFGQLWKEYSLSDSRYLTQDSFLVPMESVTAFLWGPLSYFIAYGVVTSHPLRHPLTIIVAGGQIYGDILYFATSHFEMLVDKREFCRPENFYYFMYYVFFNAIWIVIPGYLLVSSVRATSAAFAQVQKAEKGKKGQ